MPIAEDYRLRAAERLCLATAKIVHFPSSMAAAHARRGTPWPPMNECLGRMPWLS